MTVAVCRIALPISMQERIHRPIDPVDKQWIFEQAIWRNPAICNNCFSRLKDVITVDAEHYRQSAISEQIHYKTDGAVIGFDATEPPETVVNQRPKYSQRTTCAGCGSVGGYAEPDTLSRREALSLCIPLRRRLVERGYEVDLDRLKEMVRVGKSRESLQGFDREIFAVAVKYAARKADISDRSD